MVGEELEKCAVCGKGSWSPSDRPGRCPVCNSPIWNRGELAQLYKDWIELRARLDEYEAGLDAAETDRGRGESVRDS